MIRLVRASALPDRDSMACRVLDSCITLVLLLHSSPPVQCVAVRSWRSTVHICSPRRWKPFCRWPLDLSVDLGGAWSLAIVTEAGSICSSQSGQLDAAARYLRRPAKCPFCVLGSHQYFLFVPPSSALSLFQIARHGHPGQVSPLRFKVPSFPSAVPPVNLTLNGSTS